ncbi:helix-turn-helix domain-containing protein [Bacteroides congonensis]
MNIFASPQVSSCVNYLSDSIYGFSYWELNEGEVFTLTNKKNNHIIFVITGQLSINCDQFDNIPVCREEMIFLPNKSDCGYKVLSASKILVFTFDRFRNQCDKYTFQMLAEKSEGINYALQALKIHDLLKDYILLLIRYIQKGVNCYHLHEEKQQELFILLRACYTREEILFFFYPLITHDMDFRQIVLERYLEAKNVKEFARLTGYNISDFRNKFLVNFGEPAYQWMQKRKSNSIRFKLITENTDIATLSDELGFSSPAHFNKFCKKVFGMPPAKLRKQLRSQ